MKSELKIEVGAKFTVDYETAFVAMKLLEFYLNDHSGVDLIMEKEFDKEKIQVKLKLLGREEDI